MKYLLFCAVLFAAILSCKPNNTVNEKIIGTWEMAKVYDGDTDVTCYENFDPNDNRWIEFRENGVFISDGDPYGRNLGKWSYSDSLSVLFLDSNVGEGDDSYWIVGIKKDSMFWKGYNSPFTERFTVIYTRQKNNQASQ